MDFRDDWERAEHDYVQCLKRLEAARADLDAARKALLDLTPEEGRNGRLLNVPLPEEPGRRGLEGGAARGPGIGRSGPRRNRRQVPQTGIERLVRPAEQTGG